MHVTAIIAAGGRGQRLGADLPKQLLDLGGKPMLQWSVDAFLACARVDEVVVVVPRQWADLPPDCLRAPRIRIVVGGARRQDSVANGFDAVAPGSDVVVIHDAARPFIDQAMIERAIDAAVETGAAIVAMAALDTVKWSPARETPARATGTLGIVERTLPRESVFMAQTPQAFRRDVLRDAVALGRRGVHGTDEAALAEQAGHAVSLVEGGARNMKVTTADDLAMARALVERTGERPSSTPGAGRWRVGAGYDLHRLVEGRPLVLGGVTVPFERGLAGHSDADVLCHAITDAMLGAAAAGDIGVHFPDTDERWRGASSIDLLARVTRLVSGRGFRVVNVDATLVAERPPFAPHRASVVARLSAALGVAADAVSVKAKTNEGLDATGRGEAMAAHAVVLLERGDHEGWAADSAR